MATQRAIPATRRTQPSARSTRPHANTKRQNSSSALHKSSGNKGGQDLPLDESFDEEFMAASFPNFCTFCEKQISVPSPSILYCSENCRKKDQTKALSYSALMPNSSPPTMSTSTFSPHPGDLPTRDIVPQRSPTALNRNRFSSQSSIFDMSEEDTYSEDESPHERRRPTVSRKGSEADRYLRQFRAKDAVVDCTSSTPKPRYNRSSTSMSGMGSAPGLSHSPSFSDAMSLPYTPSTRPLPPRSNPFSSSYGPKSTDLVNPFAVLPIATTSMSFQGSYSIAGPRDRPQSQDEHDGMRYEKTMIAHSPAAGSLKQLFKFNEMQSAPGQTYPKY